MNPAISPTMIQDKTPMMVFLPVMPH
jgi:hypothetical protein